MATGEFDTYNLVQDLALAVAYHTRRILNEERAQGRLNDPFIYAIFIESDTTDPNLSTIQLADGSVIQGVAKMAHVTGLVNGMSIMVIATSGKTLRIVGINEGNVAGVEL